MRVMLPLPLGCITETISSRTTSDACRGNNTLTRKRTLRVHTQAPVLGALILGEHAFSSFSQLFCASGTSRSLTTMVVHVF
ncbi:hypothetical protein M405DRAFT_491301 [Rhizopogon salebrosus TDB-379]|nr:hypothetical protein M405DRAFT_491301 [Rhizopogon salebrosus TDB-379]